MWKPNYSSDKPQTTKIIITTEVDVTNIKKMKGENTTLSNSSKIKKRNRKNRSPIDAPNTHIHDNDHSISCLCTDSLITSGGINFI